MTVQPSETFVFQASGPDFRPGMLAIPFSAAYGAGEIATFGIAAGEAARRGSALYIPPSVLPGTGSALERVAAHLATLQPALRDAGAMDFVLHMTSHGTTSGNFEFSRRELAALAALDCHLLCRSVSMESESDGT